MGTVRKVVVGVLLAVFLLPVVAFVGYDLVSFQTRRSEIQQLIRSGTPEEQHPPEIVVRLLHVGYPERLHWLVTRILVAELITTPRTPTLRRQLTELLWSQFVALHLSEEEQVAVIAARSYVGNQAHGFSAASEFMFHRPLSALSAPEAASVVAVIHGPSYYLRKPERLIARRDILLSRLQNGS